MIKFIYILFLFCFNISFASAVVREDLSFKGSHDLANRPLYGSTVLILSPTLEECATGIQLDEKTVLTTAHAFRGLSHSECVVVSGNPIRVITSGETVDLEKTIERLSPTQWSHFDAVDCPTVEFKPAVNTPAVKKTITQEDGTKTEVLVDPKDFVADRLRAGGNLDEFITASEDFIKCFPQLAITLTNGTFYITGSDLRILKLKKEIIPQHGEFLALCKTDPKEFSGLNSEGGILPLSPPGNIPGMGLRIKTNTEPFAPCNIISDENSRTHQRHLITQRMFYDDQRKILYSKFHTICCDEEYFVVEDKMPRAEGLFVGGDSGAPWIILNTSKKAFEIAGVVSQYCRTPLLKILREMYLDPHSYVDIKEKIEVQARKAWAFYNISYSVYPCLEWIESQMEKRAASSNV